VKCHVSGMPPRPGQGQISEKLVNSSDSACYRVVARIVIPEEQPRNTYCSHQNTPDSCSQPVVFLSASVPPSRSPYDTVHCTLCTVHCTLYGLHCALYTALYAVHCTLYTVCCTTLPALPQGWTTIIYSWRRQQLQLKHPLLFPLGRHLDAESSRSKFRAEVSFETAGFVLSTTVLAQIII